MSAAIVPIREPDRGTPERERDAIDADIERQIERLVAAVPGVRVVLIARTTVGAVGDVFEAFGDTRSVRMFIYGPARERMCQRRR